MKHRITVMPSGQAFTAGQDETLLDAALRQGVSLPYGCRDGVCGTCRGRLVAGRVEYDQPPPALGATEQAAGVVLVCRARACSDLILESRIAATPDYPVKTLPARVEKMERLAPDVMLLQLKLPANEHLQFLAGQYIDILLKDGRRRSFSLANAPHDDALLQLHVRQVAGGEFTGKVFSDMKVRDILRINGPHGAFHLRADSAKPIILLAGGTGFAPIKAIIEHALHEKERRSMQLYWGACGLADLYLAELPQQWTVAGKLSYVPVLSDPAAERWQGRRGWVHEAVLADHPDLSGFQVYAAGPPAMIEAARREFVAAGLPEDAYFADAFSYAV